MREILSRGKRVDNGEWMYKSLICYHGTETRVGEKEELGAELNFFGYYKGELLQIIPETVGQYVGFTDKNGTHIFEGDICIINTANIDHKTDRYFVVNYDTNKARFICSSNGLCVDFNNIHSHEIIVVGNIHDNPELLEGEKINEKKYRDVDFMDKLKRYLTPTANVVKVVRINPSVKQNDDFININKSVIARQDGKSRITLTKLILAYEEISDEEKATLIKMIWENTL